MTCAETRDLFSALADDALTPTERAALDAHVAGCAECRRELATLLRTVKLVRAMDPVRAPAGFVDRVVAAAQPAPWPRRLARRLARPWPTLPLGAAALLLIGGLAVLLFRASPEQQRAAQSRLQSPPGPAAPARPDPARARVAPEPKQPAPMPQQPAAPASEPPKSAGEPSSAASKRAETSDEPKAKLGETRSAAREMSDQRNVAPPPDVQHFTPGRESSERAQDRSKLEQAKRRDAAPSVAQDAIDSAARGQSAAVPPAADPQTPPAPARDRQAATPPRGAMSTAPSIATAKAQPTPQISPLSRTGPMTGIPAAPPDVTARLRVADVSAAERALIALAARVGGRQTGRRIDAGRIVVELAVPRDAYARFVREATALGAVSIESQATERPTLAVAVMVSL